MSEEPQITIVADSIPQIKCPVCGHLFDNPGLQPFAVTKCPKCQFDIDVPGRLGAFLLVKCLGMGGMGGVFKAIDQVLNREVAIKVMLSSLGANEEFLQTFRREAQSVAKLNHPNIAQIYSFGEEKGQPYIVMELVKGSSFCGMMQGGKKIDPTIAMGIGRQIAKALKHASENGVIHGDVKPENILLDDKGNAKLVDFGIAALNGVQSGEAVWGTPYYIAPEKLKRQPADFRTDMYSLGATLYHAIAGVPPFEGEDANAVVRARIGNSAPALQSIVPGIPPLVNDIIARMLQEDPAGRFQSYDALLQEMDLAVGKAEAPAAMSQPPPHQSKKILINKARRAKVAVKPGASSEPVQATGANPRVTVSATHTPKPLHTEEVNRSGSGIKVALIGGLIFFLVALAVGITVPVYLMKAKEAKAKAEEEELQRNLAQSRKLMDDVLTNAREMRDKFRKNFDIARKLTDEVAATAKRISPSELRPYLEVTLPEFPGYIPEDGLKKAEEPAQTNAAEKATNAVAEAASTNAPLATTNATQSVSGDAEKSEEPQEDKPVEQEPEPAPAEETPPPVPLPPAFATVTNLLYRTAAIQQTMSNTEAFCEWLVRTRQISEDAGENSVDQRKALATRLVEEYKRYILIKDIATFSSEAVAIQRAANRVRVDLLKLGNRFKFQAEEKQRKEAQQKAEEARKKAAEEQARLVEEEVSRMTAAELTIDMEVKLFQFAAARRKLNDVGDTLKTPQAKKVLALALERVAAVEAFQNYLIKKLPGYGTIKSADRKAITFKDGKKMKWEDLASKYMVQVVRFAGTFVTADTAMQDQPASKKMQIATGAAIYLAKNVQGSATVSGMVKEMVERMIKKSPDLEADFRRFLPDGILNAPDSQ